jgi:protein SCO1/2
VKNSVVIVIALVAALSLAAGAWLARRPATAPVVSSATVLPTPRPLPDFRLTDADGSEFGKSRLLGGWTLMFFGFTNCPDICPNTMGLLKLVKSQVSHPLRVVFVSVDPQRDTPEKLSAYVKYFDADFIGVTGAEDELRKLASALYIPYSLTPPQAGGDYTVDHAGAVVLIDPQGAALAYFSPPHRPDDIVADLRSLTRS